MTPRNPSRSQNGSRLFGLDQARAIAIMAMMAFHFAPGVIKNIPELKFLELPVLWFGRMATPAFVTIFGVTAGLVFLPKFVRGDPGGTPYRLRRRALWVFVCAIIITLPHWFKLAKQGTEYAWPWLFKSYSVLLFYAVALAILPLWLRWLSRHTGIRALLSGVALWVAGTLGYEFWPQGGADTPILVPVDESGQTFKETWPPAAAAWLEFARLILLSGDYGYLQMMGTALLAMPIGLRLREARNNGSDGRFLIHLLLTGIALSAVGACWGVGLGQYDLQNIVDGKLKIPPHGWYFLHFGAVAVAAIAGLELLTRNLAILRGPGYLLALFGQTSLVLYTAHAFVLPSLEIADLAIPLHGIPRVIFGFVPFATFCAAVMYWRHRRLKRETERKSAKAPAIEPAIVE
jgi:uncharacterized membrane protein